MRGGTSSGQGKSTKGGEHDVHKQRRRNCGAQGEAVFALMNFHFSGDIGKIPWRPPSGRMGEGALDGPKTVRRLGAVGTLIARGPPKLNRQSLEKYFSVGVYRKSQLMKTRAGRSGHRGCKKTSARTNVKLRQGRTHTRGGGRVNGETGGGGDSDHRSATNARTA